MINASYIIYDRSKLRSNYIYMSYASYMLDPKLDPYLYASFLSEFMQVHLIRSSLHLYVLML